MLKRLVVVVVVVVVYIASRIVAIKVSKMGESLSAAQSVVSTPEAPELELASSIDDLSYKID